MITTHVINISEEPDEIFRVLCDVNIWPDIFPPCSYGKVEYYIEGRQKINLTAMANNRLISWASHRLIDEQQKTIKFSQTQKPDYLDYMKGTWTVCSAENGCQVVLQHDFEAKNDYDYTTAEFSEAEEVVAFYEKATETNSIRELSALKQYFENKLMTHAFSCCTTISFQEEQYFNLLKKAEHWKYIIPHCSDVEILYDDGENQEFIMTVQVGERTEKIRSIRHIRGMTIRYFQPNPPYPLTRHTGTWKINRINGQTTVTSDHQITLSPDAVLSGESVNTLKAVIEKNINNNSYQTMLALNKTLEGLASEY
ncbi:SRPBCC family protein [Enterobacter cancerogenus]|uniref:SRPBCC family protein n=1 Tax=Enterobacter cancerogenus TaxID=69218 RepID=UPI00381E00EE